MSSSGFHPLDFISCNQVSCSGKMSSHVANVTCLMPAGHSLHAIKKWLDSFFSMPTSNGKLDSIVSTNACAYNHLIS